MSKPALGRGLASLLQEETDRGAVKAPGLASFNAPAVAQEASAAEKPALENAISEKPAVPATVLPQTFEVPAPVPTPVPTPIPTTVSQAAATTMASVKPPQPSPTGHPVPVEPAHAGAPSPSIGAGSSLSAGQSAATSAQPLELPTGVPLPGWIVPALIGGDLVVVVSGILWAAWGRGLGRWPWIAALFAVGCSQAIVALWLSRSGAGAQMGSGKGSAMGLGAGSGGAGPFGGRGPAAPGQAPGIRVRFVEEQPQSRRGDRR